MASLIAHCGSLQSPIGQLVAGQMQTWGNDLGSMTSPICLFCRSQQNESACASGRAACMELQRQSDVVEYIISHTDVLFCSTSTSGIGDGAGERLPAIALS